MCCIWQMHTSNITQRIPLRPRYILMTECSAGVQPIPPRQRNMRENICVLAAQSSNSCKIHEWLLFLLIFRNSATSLVASGKKNNAIDYRGGSMRVLFAYKKVQLFANDRCAMRSMTHLFFAFGYCVQLRDTGQYK